MKWTLVFLASLLPFLHETSYEAEVKGCDAQCILLESQGERFEATLFNIGYRQEEGWKETCALLEEADEIRFEIDDAVTLQEPLPIYLFADGVMVQVTLLEKEKAYVEVHNPNYRYEDQMEMAQGTRSVMAAESRTDGKKGVPIRSYLVYGAVVFLWGLMFYHLVYKHRFLLHKKKDR